MRRFVLQRYVDNTGVSGTGVVAWGVMFEDKTAVTRWCVTSVRQTCMWQHIDDVERVHGHSGNTRIKWIDDEHAGDWGKEP